MKIAIGTTAAPKIAAIEEGIKKCPFFEGINVEIIPMSVKSGISDMPLSEEENMTGAKNRAIACKSEIEADFYIGMEGGTTMIGNKAYLFGVVYIMNNSGEGHFGFSNRMEMPEIFRKRVYDNLEDLGPVLTEITGVEGASKKTGAFGAWSDDLLTRKEQFLLAFLSAIPAFYNKYYKM
ncbi:MAG: inosine/xanthosine triphosphatase [Candidatus Gracilibacteria bacterium]|nr:inosine/xanthosine triphosphatase [Candidatus Gracilibacteria bacterium]